MALALSRSLGAEAASSTPRRLKSHLTLIKFQLKAMKEKNRDLERRASDDRQKGT